jgi:hypothetical protein
MAACFKDRVRRANGKHRVKPPQIEKAVLIAVGGGKENIGVKVDAQ